MQNRKKQLIVFFVLVNLSLLNLFVNEGCKKKTEPEKPAASQEAVAATEQKICPVMDGAVNKNLFTEYKGKKVYFCCPGCKEKFEKEPEKYLEKLPQFKK